MGNSVSLDQGHRQSYLGDLHNERSAAYQLAAEAAAPRQITVCLMPDTPEDGAQSKVQAPANLRGECDMAAAADASPDADGQQKVLLWNCNPSDTTQKDQTYAAATDLPVKAASRGSASLNKLLLDKCGRKNVKGPSFDMHPAVSSDVAGSLPRSSSSSSSSDSSYRGRSFSIDETMPHGPGHFSDDEADEHPAATSNPPRAASSYDGTRADVDFAGADQTGRLIIHPKSSSTAEQVVWVLQKQQLLDPSHTLATARGIVLDSGSRAAGRLLVSPPFILPCAQSPTQHITTEWSLVLNRLPKQSIAPNSSSSSSCSCQLGLGLRYAPVGHIGSSSASGNPADCQAPGGALHASTAAAGGSIGAEVHCRGQVTLHIGSSKQDVARCAFDISLQESGQMQELPIIVNLVDSNVDSVAPSDQQQPSATPAALSVTSEEVHLVVNFNSVRLLQPIGATTTAALVSSQPTQQQQQGTSDTATPRDLPSPAAAAAGARQLEAVLLSTSPRMLVIDGFFDNQLCNDLMQLAEGKLVRSRVASGTETPSRTSWSHFFVKDAARQALILSAESQIEALFKSTAVRGPFPPLAKVEALQVVKYHEGEFYHEHYDNRADSPLTRAATIIVYLSDTEEGGATSFPRAVTGWSDSCDWQLPPKVTFGPGGQGIKVHPVQGRALIFWSKRADGSEDPNSIHAADSVVKGEKWIATRWMKDELAETPE